MSYTLRILKASFPRKKLKDINISYIRVGDYFIPDLTLPEETRPIGRWGRMHREYLREHKPIILPSSSQPL